MRPDVPNPIAASWNFAAPIKVTFDELLTPGALNPGNWFIRHAGRRWVVVLAVIQATIPPNAIVNLLVGLSAGQPGPDVVSFTPPPFDVTSIATGLPAPAFADFPLGP